MLALVAILIGVVGLILSVTTEAKTRPHLAGNVAMIGLVAWIPFLIPA